MASSKSKLLESLAFFIAGGSIIAYSILLPMPPAPPTTTIIQTKDTTLTPDYDAMNQAMALFVASW